jgi:hypothetical protein
VDPHPLTLRPTTSGDNFRRPSEGAEHVLLTGGCPHFGWLAAQLPLRVQSGRKRMVIPGCLGFHDLVSLVRDSSSMS